MPKALIVGGGITGLATAIVLSRQGIEVDLIERQDQVHTLGSGITLIGAALCALDRLGLYTECAASGYPVTHMETYDVDGTLAARVPLPSPAAAELAGTARAKIEPFGGVVAELREAIQEPGQIHYTRFETMLLPDPWYRGRVIVAGDAAHCTTPHLAAGAAMCLEDAIALGEELAAAPTVDDALRAFCQRRFDRCRYVVETAAQLSYWQIHPGTPGADHQRVTAEAFARLAGPF